MIVDTSAVVAILAQEDGHEQLLARLGEAETKLMSAATFVELGIVIESRYGPRAATMIARFVRDAEITVIPLEVDHAERSLEGWRRYGKGRHRAKLYLGDCYTYGLATATGQPVLCTGNDFAATDLDVIRPEAEDTERLNPGFPR